ncbi:MAG: hypothetical protein IPM77_01180 [Crocinitomicaceae bacterium]|nr:hypothetical protein [Crocinitomicaceae bacterium]
MFLIRRFHFCLPTNYKIFGGPNTQSIRNLNLVIHFFCTILLYLIAVSLKSSEQKNQISIAGLTASFLYLFACGNLWMHGNLYFADMLVQLFVIASIYLIVRFVKKQYQHEWIILSLLTLTFFLATYTEWLGLFLAFFSGLFFFIFWIIKRSKRYLKAFLLTALAASLALVTTITQYSSIAGWDKLKAVSMNKYGERSGHQAAEETPNRFSIDNHEAFDFMIGRLDDFYKMPENFVGIFGILFLVTVLIPNARRRIENAGAGGLIVGLIAFSVLLHYYLFFNFNSLHDFSSLKTGFLLILATLVFISLIESALSINFRLIVFVLAVYLSVDKGIESVESYKETFPLSEVDWNRIATGKAMREHGRKDAAIYMNISSNPELVLEAGHNVFPLKDTADIRTSMEFFGNSQAQYYHHQGSQLEYILEYELIDNQFRLLGRTGIMNGTNTTGRAHQK